MKFLSRFMQKFGNEPDKKGPPTPNPAPNFKVQLKEQNEPFDRKPVEKDDISLELGDFLHRIPAQVLLAGPHNLKAELRFSIRYLSERIADGETTIPLAEIYNRIPTIFRGQIRVSDNIDIRFPWQKIARLVANTNLDPSVVTNPEAEILAAKLKQRKPKKKPKAAPLPGQEATDSTASPAAPILPGRGTNSAPWFSKTTIEPGAAKPAEEQKVTRITNEPPAPTAPTDEAKEQPEFLLRLKTSDSKTDEQPSKREQPPDVPRAENPQPAPIATPPESDVAKLKPEDELRIAELPAELQRKVAQLRGSYERQIGELERTRRNEAVELERLREELRKATNVLAEEQTATAVSRELIQKAQAERAHAQKELAEVSEKLASLQSGSKFDELTAERDALLKQKAHLSAQVAELSKRGISPSRPGEQTGGTAHNARNAEELQRRIALMEASQRETALELSREKEARAKAEKMLIAADKLQEQSANYMESAKTEMRKEIEASVKVREIELRKSQKELQDRINALSDQTRIAATDLENARKRIAELESANPSEEPRESAMQAQLVAQLEEDIENYRGRLKVLIAERDEARAALDRAGREVTGDASAKIAAEEIAGLRKLHAEQEREFEKLKREHAEAETRFAKEQSGYQSRFDSLRQALDAARDAHAAQLATIEKQRNDGSDPATEDALKRANNAEKLASERSAMIAELESELGKLRQQFDDLATKHSEAVSKRESAEKERDNSIAALREQSVSLEQQISTLAAERDELRGKVGRLEDELRTANAAREELISALDHEHTAVVRANEILQKRVAELEENKGTNAALESEIADLRGQLASSTRERDEILDANEAALAKSRNEMESATANLSKEQARAEQLERELASAREQGEQLRSDLINAAGTQTHRDELTERLKELEEKHASSIAELTDEHRAATKSHEETCEKLNAELESLRNELATARNERTPLESRVSDAEAELDRLRQKHAYSLIQLEEEVQAARSAVVESKETAEAKSRELNAERDARTSDNAAAAAEIQSLATKYREAIAKLDALSSQHATELAALRDDAAATARERDALVEQMKKRDARPESQSAAKANIRPDNVIDVELPEILPGGHPNNINIPLVRPVPIPPPRVHRG